MNRVPVVRGLRSLVDRYDTFIVDLWGTLHDGVTPYPGAIDALVRLQNCGKQVALLSNAPKRASWTAQFLTSLGIPESLYTTLLTSGESVYVALRDRPDAWHRQLSGPCWLLGSQRDTSLFDGLDLTLTDAPDGAGFCVATGTRVNGEQVEDRRDELDRAIAAGIPMICANPDLIVPAGSDLVLCAGAFARYYEENGGRVFWHGKPYSEIYRTLTDKLAVAMDRPVDGERVLAVGDGMSTDIAGASKLGFASALVAGGLHRRDLKLNWLGRPSPAAYEALAEQAKARPNHVLKRFVW